MNLHCSRALCFVVLFSSISQKANCSTISSLDSLVQQKKFVKLCQQLYTKAIRLKNMCHYCLAVILSTSLSFAFINLGPWNDGSNSVLNSLAKGNLPF